MVESKTYTISSAFIKQPIEITCTHVGEQPIEMKIRSEGKMYEQEFELVSRLVTFIFQSMDPFFLVEEFYGIGDPGGSQWANGERYLSIYSEIAGVLKVFYEEIG